MRKSYLKNNITTKFHTENILDSVSFRTKDKRMKGDRYTGEERCECGMLIPKGYGYYNYGKAVKCFGCGRINRKDRGRA